MHIGEERYEKYDPNNLDECARNPSKYSFASALEKTVSLIAEGNLAVSHLEHSEKKAQMLKDFKKILITRNRKEIGESAARWKKDYKRGKGMPPKYDYESIEKWSEEKDVFHIDFYDIININKVKLDELQRYLFPEKDNLYDSALCARTAMSKDSITKSQFRGTGKKMVTNLEHLQIRFSKLFSRLFKK